MFKTIEAQGAAGDPQWLSDHPNPGDRSAYITQEAQRLHVENPIRDTRAFNDVRSSLQRMSPAPTTEEATRRGAGRAPTGTSSPPDRTPTGRVEPPSPRFRTFREGDLFQVSVPANWAEIQGSNAVTFAPDGAYGTYNGQRVFTHGVEIGSARNEAHDLQSATNELIGSLARTNPRLGRPTRYERISVDGRLALRTTLSNTSEATGNREAIQIVTTRLRDGSILYAIGVAPQNEFTDYRGVFDRIARSLQVYE